MQRTRRKVIWVSVKWHKSQISDTKNPGLSTRVFAIDSKITRGFFVAPRRSVGLEADMAQRTGLEPATPGVTGRYSNRLNYRCVSLWTYVLTRLIESFEAFNLEPGYT
jgi:hypothetical protein